MQIGSKTLNNLEKKKSNRSQSNPPKWNLEPKHLKCLFCPDLAGIICHLEFIKESSIQTKSKRSFLGYKKYTKKIKETT